MILSELFPEVDRYWSTEMRPGRLTMGALTALGVGFCLFTAAQAGPDPGAKLFLWSFLVQAVVLLGYGTARVAASVINERADRTWDLQRLTPQSSAELSGGKLLGAPVFAYFLSACFLPWVLIGYASAGGKAGSLLWAYALLASCALLCLSVGLLVSAYADKTIAGGAPTTAAALVGFGGLQAAFGIVSLVTGHEGTRYFGLPVSAKSLLAASFTAFGCWALAAARWRIGKDLLEPRRFWRLPAFIGFLTVYQLGFEGRTPAYALLLPWLFCYFVAILNPEAPEQWKRWSAARGVDWWNRMPAWLSAAAFCALLSLMMAAPYPLLQACFAVRDLCLLQLCRFTRSRRPEIMALVFIALLYFLPAVVLAAFRSQAFYFFFPAPDEHLGLARSLAPGALQAVLLAALLSARWRALKAEAAPSAA